MAPYRYGGTDGRPSLDRQVALARNPFEPDAEGGAFTLAALDVQVAAVRIENSVNDGEP